MSERGTIAACTSAGTGTLCFTSMSTRTWLPCVSTLLTFPAGRPSTRTSESLNRATVLGNQAVSLYFSPPPPPITLHEDSKIAATTRTEIRDRRITPDTARSEVGGHRTGRRERRGRPPV